MRLRNSLARIMDSAGPTMRRFWVPIGFTIALTGAIIMAITGRRHSPNDPQVRFALAMIPSILTAWCAILGWERGSREPRSGPMAQMNPELAGNLIALPAAAVVSASTYFMLKDFTLVTLSRHTAICLSSFLAFFVIPHFRKEGSLEMYTVKLFSHAVVSVLFSAVMFIGLSAITFTVSSLFSLNVSHYAYIRIFLVMMGVLAPFLFMAGIPKGTVRGEAEDYPKVLRNLILFVVTPLLTAYTVILYLYFAKILVTREWPVGLVSHLVLWYSLVSTALLFFVWPLASANKWGDTFARFFPRASIPLLFMMFASVGIRIHYYGITENRYYVLVLGLWLLGTTLYLCLRKSRRNVGIPVSLAMIILLSVVGPWSSFSVSKWSQNQRLENLLTKHDMIKDHEIVPSAQTVPETDRREIAEILFYFDRNHDLSQVRVLPAGFGMGQFATVFGFDYLEYPAVPRQYLEYVAENQALDVGGYRYLFDFAGNKYVAGPVFSLNKGNVNVIYDRERHKISVALNGNLEWEQSLSEYIGGILEKYGPLDKMSLLPEDAVLLADTDNLRIKLVITGAWGGVDAASQGMVIHQLWFFLLTGEK